MIKEKTKKIVVKALHELPAAASALISFAEEHLVDVWLFEGRMGAGKTTFIRSICAKLGVLDNVQSPTFSIVNEYLADRGNPVYHFDFYRIEKEEEAVNIGAEEYFFSGHICMIEWPSKVLNLLPDEYLRVEIEMNQDNSRTLLLSINE